MEHPVRSARVLLATCSRMRQSCGECAAHRYALRTGTSVWVGGLDTDEFNAKFDSFRYAPRRARGSLLGRGGPARKVGICWLMLPHVGSCVGSCWLRIRNIASRAAEDPTRNRWDKGCPTTLVGTTESGFATKLLVASCNIVAAKAICSCSHRHGYRLVIAPKNESERVASVSEV